MGKVKWNTKAAEVDEAEERESDFTPYEGDVPPPGVYRLSLRFAQVFQFSSGNSGLKILAIVDEPKSSAKAKYNGAPIWEQLVDIDTQTFKIKQFMRSIGGTGRHWANTVSAEDDRGNEMVTKFGPIVVEGLKLKAQLRREMYQGDPQAKVARWLPKADESDDDNGSDGSADDSDGAPF
jgi:hypothetical protein